MAYTYDDFLKQANDTGLLGQLSKYDLETAKKSPEFGISILGLTRDINNAATEEQKLLASDAANLLRKSYGSYTLGADGTYQPVFQSGESTDGSFTYSRENEYQAALSEAANPGSFTYNAESDPVAAAYKKAYLREGDRAAEDTLAKVSAATGGRPSSYAVAASQQAQNYYNAQLADKLPELEGNAYQRYLQEIAKEQGVLSLLENDRENEYSKWLQDYSIRQVQEQEALAREEAAAKLMAQGGDFSRLAAIYGLTDAEVAVLKGDYEAAQADKVVEALKTKYPDGTVGSELEWELLKAQYGEDVLREAGLSFQQEVKDKIPDSVLSYITAKYPNKTVTSSEDWKLLLDTYGADLLEEAGIAYQLPQGVATAPASPVGIKKPAVDQIVSGMTSIDSKVPVHQFVVSQTSGKKSPNLLDNGKFLISGREMTVAEVLKGVQNGTIIETDDPKTDSYTYTIRKTGSGSTNAKSQTAMLN